MTVKKKTTKLTDATTIGKEVPYFIKREAMQGTPVGGSDYVIFPDSMPLVDSITGSEPIMVQSPESEEPKTITPTQLKSWLTGGVNAGNDGFIMGDTLYHELLKYVPKTRTINGKALDKDIILEKSDVGLGNVDNTPDLDKPISNAVQAALDELRGDLDGEANDLADQINQIDKIVNKHTLDLYGPNGNDGLIEHFEGLFEDFGDHVHSQRPHGEAVMEIAERFFDKMEYIPEAAPDKYPIPSVSFLRGYSERWLPMASVKDTLDSIYDNEKRGDTYLTGYTENFDPALVPLRKISLKELKTYIDSKAAGGGLKNLPSTVVGSSMSNPISSSAGWPDLRQLVEDSSGYLVYVGGIPLNEADAVHMPQFGPIRNPHDNQKYPQYSVLLYKEGVYTILGFWKAPIGGSLLTRDNNALLRLITQDTMQHGLIGYDIEIPFASMSNDGLLKSGDFNKLMSIIPFDREGTPYHSWTIGKDTEDPLTITKYKVWDPTETEPEPEAREGEDGTDEEEEDDDEFGDIPHTSSTLVEFTDNTDTVPGLRIGDLVIMGNVVQKGSTFLSEAEELKVKDNMITLNEGEMGQGVTAGISGLEIDRGSLPKYQIVFDESDDRFKAGVEGNLRNLMLRDTDAMMDNAIGDNGHVLIWDSANKIARSSIMNVHDFMVESQVQDLLEGYFKKTGGVINGTVTLGLPNATDYKFYRIRRGGYTGELSVADGRTNVLATRDSDSVQGTLSIGLTDITFNGKALALSENVPAPITGYAGSSSTGGPATASVNLIDGAGNADAPNIQVRYSGTSLNNTTATYLAAWGKDTVDGKRILRDITAAGALALIGAAPASHTHTKSQITDFPTALKNPSGLTISLNGTSQGAYDGSAAKSINITAASVGAATSGHTHSTMVTTDTNQTISGVKTFTKYQIFSAGAGTASTSDMRFKRVLREFDPDECLEWVSQSPGFEYEWKGGFQNVGTSAQYWEERLDKLVVHTEDKNKTLAFSYERYTIILQEAIKALLKRVQTLENVINHE